MRVDHVSGRLGLLLLLAVAAVVGVSVTSSGDTVLVYPRGPIDAFVLSPDSRLRGRPDLPRSLIVRDGHSREFQILTVSTEFAGLENGPLSRKHLQRIRDRHPDYGKDVSIGGFLWRLELSSGAVSQMLAVAYADGVTIGVIGAGEWSVEEAETVLQGIKRRRASP